MEELRKQYKSIFAEIDEFLESARERAERIREKQASFNAVLDQGIAELEETT